MVSGGECGERRMNSDDGIALEKKRRSRVMLGCCYVLSVLGSRNQNKDGKNND